MTHPLHLHTTYPTPLIPYANPQILPPVVANNGDLFHIGTAAKGWVLERKPLSGAQIVHC